MKTFAFPCLLAAGLALAAPAGAQQFQVQDMMSTYNQAETVAKLKQMDVRTAREVTRAFDLATKERGRQAIEISCKPADSEWCAGGFVAACDKAKGVLSSEDGGVKCDMPQHK